VTTSTFYEPSVLSDYGGEVFQHSESKLRQLDIRDVDNELIAPQNWYDQLRRGTLVSRDGQGKSSRVQLRESSGL
jgi:hypothetical protein